MRITIALERRPKIREEKPLKRPERHGEKQRQEEDRLLYWLDTRKTWELADIRLSAGWTQAEVAEHIGCSPGLITKWERGRIGWSRDFGLKYAALLKELEVLRDS